MSAEQLLKDVRDVLDKTFSNSNLRGAALQPQDMRNLINATLDAVVVGDYMPSVIEPARNDLDSRLAALAAARAHVKALADEKNARGYSDNAITANRRIEEELRVARFLLGQEEN